MAIRSGRCHHQRGRRWQCSRGVAVALIELRTLSMPATATPYRFVVRRWSIRRDHDATPLRVRCATMIDTAGSRCRTAPARVQSNIGPKLLADCNYIAGWGDRLVDVMGWRGRVS